ncbi:MAG: pimeloyl-ACP methyl ester carboxylesterase [Oleiphilaceae bacterium]|jgi:pimeloyl-ACP methyl ester carboxylesterase
MELILSIIEGLQTWEYKLPAGFTVRGYHSKPSGKPVLHFIHGTGFSGLTFEHLLAEFQNDYDFFISDGQGHGESDAGEIYPGWNKSARNFALVWQHYAPLWGGVPKIALGHSYGAVMSTLIMAKHPDLFDFGMLMDPVYSSPKVAKAMSVMTTLGLMKRMTLAKQAKVRSMVWASESDAWSYFYQRGTFKGWKDDCLQSYIDHALSKHADGSLHLKCPPKIESAVFSAYAHNLWQSINTIQKPMTILYGEDTHSFVIKSLPKVHKANINYDFIKVQGGHCFMQENPKQTAQEIKQKLRFLLRTFKRRVSAE